VETQTADVVAFSRTAPLPGRKNEDGIGIAELGARGVVAVLADGAGGHSLGDKAAELAVKAVVMAVADTDDDDVRGGVLLGFDRANEAVLNLGVGAATTLAVVHL
jgi:serine/threonine protein phosphatase PrpC